MSGKHSQVSQKKYKSTKKLSVFKIIVILLIVVLIVIGGIAAAGYIYLDRKISKVNYVEIDKTDLGITEETKEKLTGYRNIAIFGVDSREDDYGKGNRSDCIIIASINNSSKEIKLFSVYRDTYVKIEGHGLDKITHAYSYGEAPLALKTLNTNLDLNISEFVTVNFNSVAEAVDALGGVEIDIQSDEIKYANDYIDKTSKNTKKTSTHITKAGKQLLDGVQAVSYSRIRYTAGGDAKRAERMRTVLEAMIEKLKTKNAGELNNFANVVLPRFYTNIEKNDIMSMIPDIMKFKVINSVGWPYETKGITLDRWYGVPVTLESNVIRLHKELFGEQNYQLPSSVKTISDSIVKKTGYR